MKSYKVTAMLIDGKTMIQRIVSDDERRKMINSPWIYLWVNAEEI